MSEEKYTKGEWYFDESDTRIKGQIEERPTADDILPNHNRMRIIATEHGRDEEGLANGHRIVDCINACRSLSTAALESGIVEKLVEYWKIGCEIDKLRGDDDDFENKLGEMCYMRRVLNDEIIKLLQNMPDRSSK